MEWAEIVAELEASYDADERRELDAEVADRTHREVARLRLIDRLRAATGQEVTLTCGAAGTRRGRVVAAGTDWLLLADDARSDVVVAVAAITTARELGPWASEPDLRTPVDRRLGLGVILRRLARDRRVLDIALTDGTRMRAIVARVGADFVDLAPPVAAKTTPDVCVPHTALAMLRCG